MGGGGGARVDGPQQVGAAAGAGRRVRGDAERRRAHHATGLDRRSAVDPASTHVPVQQSAAVQRRRSPERPILRQISSVVYPKIQETPTRLTAPFPGLPG